MQADVIYMYICVQEFMKAYVHVSLAIRWI